MLEALRRKAEMVERGLAGVDGIRCNPVAGAMYAFPQIHLPPGTTDGDWCLALLEETAHAHAALVRSLGGTLTGEHGDGRLRAPLLPGAFPEVFPLFRAVKRLFDPEGILNPGVIVPLAGARVTDGIERPRGAQARPDGEEGWKLFLSHRARLEESGGEIA